MVWLLAGNKRHPACATASRSSFTVNEFSKLEMSRRVKYFRRNVAAVAALEKNYYCKCFAERRRANTVVRRA